MKKRSKAPIRPSHDGIDRRTVRIEIRLTKEDETLLDLMYMNFATHEETTFQEFLAILLRRTIDAERVELQDAMDSEGLR